MDALLQDLRYAFRSLRKSPGFTAVAVLTLALGIGATTAIFSVIDGVLLEPLPYAAPERTVMLWSSWKDFPQTWVSYDEFEAYRDEVGAFEEIGLWYGGLSATVEGRGEAERVPAVAVTRNLFRILGVETALGRAFLPEEDVPGNDAAVILGYDLWQRRFGGDPSIVGRPALINGTERLVVGVLPAGFRMPVDYGAGEPTEAWFPLAAQAEDYEAVAGPEIAFGGGAHTFYAVARLAPGATVEQANAELGALTARLAAQGVYPADWGFQATAIPLPEEVTGTIRPVLLVLLGAVALVLLIACANVAGLLLVRGEVRRREIGIRAALGAGRGRLAWQFLTESVLLSLVGGAIGVWLAWLGVQAVRAVAPESLPRIDEIGVDGVVLAFATIASLATAVLTGELPALRAAGMDPSKSLKDGQAATPGSGRLRTRHALVALQIALAVVLVIGAGLTIRSVRNLLAIDPGFSGEDVLTMQVSLPSARYPDAAEVAAFYAELQPGIAELPGVEAAGAVRVLPLATDIGDMGVHVPGHQHEPGDPTAAEWQVATPGFFEAMGTELLAGRFIDERDHADAPLVLVINRSFADKYFAGRDPLGRPVVIGGGPAWSVIGVVEDTRHNGLTGPVRPRFYAPHAQLPSGFEQRTMSLVIKANRDPTSLIQPVRGAIRRMDPRLAISDVRLMEKIVGESVAGPRFAMLLLAAFAGLALVLGAVGIYGVIAYAVSQRTREIGVRIALGAGKGRVLSLIVRQGLAIALVGIVIGLAAAFMATRVLGSVLYGVSATDPITFAGVTLMLALVALLASWIPARRAARVDPMVALRSE
ncbi:MAG: ABC transporter permease [Gemmatimonadota bacterium]